MTEELGVSPTGPGSREPSHSVLAAGAASIPNAVEALLSGISLRRVEINAVIAGLRAELAEIDRIEYGLTSKTQLRREVMRFPRGNSIAAAAIEILADGPLGAKEIVDRMPIFYGRTIQRESIAPHLSRLKYGGFLNHTGRIWSLTAQAIEARRAETGMGSVHESAVSEGNAP